MTMTNDEAASLARDLSGRSGFAKDVTGGSSVVFVKTLTELKAANVRGNIILADPTLPLETTWSTASFNLADDTTFDAPAGNLTLLGSVRPGNNCIVRRVGFGRYGTAADIAWIDPATKSNIWFDENRIVGPSNDGGLDIAASTLTDASPPCYVTVSNCTFENVDKTMLVDSLLTHLSEPKIFLTLTGNKFVNCKQRMPSAGYNALVHAHYNEIGLAADGVMGMLCRGGKLIATGNKFSGPAGQQSVEIWDGGTFVDGGNDWGPLLPPITR